MRNRNVDVLRPVVELINFNLNVIKICGFPAFSMKQPRRVLWQYFEQQLGMLSGFILHDVIFRYLFFIAFNCLIEPSLLVAFFTTVECL